MSIQRPTASFVTDSGGAGLVGSVNPFGGGALDLASAGVHLLVIDLGVGRAHDRLELTVSHLSPLADVSPGTRMQVGLSASGDAEDVLAVDIMSLQDTPQWRRLVGLAPSHSLDDLFLSRTYVQQSVADVVEDLLAEAEVDAGPIDAGRQLAHFHVDGKRSAWQNLHLLAELFGSQISSEADGALSFKPAPGADAGGLGGALGAAASAAGAAAGALGLGGDDGLRRGANVLTWAVGDLRPQPATMPEVAALGAASPFGAPRGHHLLKEPEGGSIQTLVKPSLRDADSAGAAAQALSAAASRSRRGGRFSVLGDPILRAGAEVTVDDETWHLRSVRHRVDSVDGYVCHLRVEGMP